MIDSFKCDDGDTLLIPKKSFSLREDTEDNESFHEDQPLSPINIDEYQFLAYNLMDPDLVDLPTVNFNENVVAVEEILKPEYKTGEIVKKWDLVMKDVLSPWGATCRDRLKQKLQRYKLEDVISKDSEDTQKFTKKATFAHFLKKIDFADSDSSKKKTNEIHLINKNNINIVNQKTFKGRTEKRKLSLECQVKTLWEVLEEEETRALNEAKGKAKDAHNLTASYTTSMGNHHLLSNDMHIRRKSCCSYLWSGGISKLELKTIHMFPIVIGKKNQIKTGFRELRQKNGHSMLLRKIDIRASPKRKLTSPSMSISESKSNLQTPFSFKKTRSAEKKRNTQQDSNKGHDDQSIFWENTPLPRQKSSLSPLKSSNAIGSIVEDLLSHRNAVRKSTIFQDPLETEIKEKDSPLLSINMDGKGNEGKKQTPTSKENVFYDSRKEENSNLISQASLLKIQEPPQQICKGINHQRTKSEKDKFKFQKPYFVVKPLEELVDHYQRRKNRKYRIQSSNHSISVMQNPPDKRHLEIKLSEQSPHNRENEFGTSYQNEELKALSSMGRTMTPASPIEFIKHFSHSAHKSPVQRDKFTFKQIDLNPTAPRRDSIKSIYLAHRSPKSLMSSNIGTSTTPSLYATPKSANNYRIQITDGKVGRTGTLLEQTTPKPQSKIPIFGLKRTSLPSLSHTLCVSNSLASRNALKKNSLRQEENHMESKADKLLASINHKNIMDLYKEPNTKLLSKSRDSSIKALHGAVQTYKDSIINQNKLKVNNK